MVHGETFQDEVSGEAALAAVLASGGDVRRIPAHHACAIRPGGVSTGGHSAYAPVWSKPLPRAMAALQDDIEAFLTRETRGADGVLHTNYERLRFGVHDECGEASIYAGTCSGRKSQPPLSAIMGQYNTAQAKPAGTEGVLQERTRVLATAAHAMAAANSTAIQGHGAVLENHTCLLAELKDKVQKMEDGAAGGNCAGLARTPHQGRFVYDLEFDDGDEKQRVPERDVRHSADATRMGCQRAIAFQGSTATTPMASAGAPRARGPSASR